MGFTLRITNAPEGATVWTAFFYSSEEQDFIKPPEPLALDEIWDCPFDPEGTTNLHLGVKDEIHDIILLDVRGIGPVNDGLDYEFDCSTLELTVITVEPPANEEIGVSLKAGGNFVVYTGKVQSGSDAFASIISYVEVVYYYNNATGLYEIPITMVPYAVYWIEVTQACTWTYGAEAAAPSSVQLYEGWNLVGWPGQAISVADAFASIAAYVASVYYYNNATGLYEIPTTMVHNGVYWVAVSQDCVWTFEVPELVPSEITITAPNSAAEGETVNASVKIKNVSAYDYRYKATISAVPDLYPDYVIGTIRQAITSGEEVTVDTPFTMPDCNVTIFVLVERWAFDRYVYDNSASKVVSLEVPATYHLDIYVPPWAAGGYVEPGSGDYPAHTTVKLTAHPLDGYQFTSWGGDASGTDPTFDLYMDSDKNVEAYFEEIPVPIYEGTISKKELEYDETRGSIPVY